MKKVACLALLSVCLLTLSCKKESAYAKYEGIWSGSYTGEDTGEWEVNINDEGKLSGTAKSDSVPDYPFEITGSITSGGKFQAEVDVFLGTIDFDGQLSGSNAAGTWNNADAGIEGTWSGKKN